MPPTIYFIDGHALAYRAYFALTRGNPAGFSTRSGESTAGIFGFTSILLRILEQDRPEYLAVAFDTGKTFRDEVYPEYKGTREKMPDDLRPQIDRIRQLIDAFNIPRLELEGYEADDILGSAARLAKSKGFAVKIITGDRDLLQLVEERIVVNLPGKSISDAKDYFPEDVINYFGVKPEQVVDYKSLVGDKSDNIPGVAGIGEKTASNLLKEFETLDNIYRNLDKVSEAIGKKLQIGKEAAYLSKKLATIITNLDLKLDFEQAKFEQFEPTKVEALFRELEFRTLMNRLISVEKLYGKGSYQTEKQLDLFSTRVEIKDKLVIEELRGDLRVIIVDNSEKMDSMLCELMSAQTVSLDTETTSTDQMKAELVGISLATHSSQGYYIPVGHTIDQGPQLPQTSVLNTLARVLTDENIAKVGHNLKYDFIILARHGLRVSPLKFDTMLAEWLVRPDSRNLGLKNLAWVRLDQRMTEIEELIGKGKNQISMAQVSIEKVARYAAMDAAIIFKLLPILREDLEQCHATDLFNQVEIPLIPILADMEMTGIGLDINLLNKMSQELGLRLSELERQIYSVAGEEFNINSPQQLSEVIFNKLKITPPNRMQRTATGFYSTSAEVLEYLRGKHPLVDWLIEYRELAKLKSTYLDALPSQLNSATKRIHTSYNQTGSVTGRLASSNPNLQNIPIRTEVGRQVRRAFIAEPENYLLSVDYSQVELRIVAHIANDIEMLASFRRGEDIHAATAAAIYRLPIEKVSQDQRRHAKAINFGLIYGMSAYGLTRTTDLTLAEAEDFVAAYFKQFPGIKNYLSQVRMQAYEAGFVETLLGRRRYFPGLRTQKNQNIRNREEREAINAPIQGTAADIIKIAMIRIPISLKQAGLSGKMLLQVHDEIVLECVENEVKQTATVVQEVMASAYHLNIPLLTEACFGKNWGEMEKVE